MSRILLIDDHSAIRQGIAQLLLARNLFTEAVEASTGAEALALAERGPWAMVLLDISLPDMSGVEVLRRIKRLSPSLPVLIFSMYREDQYAVRALKAGASGYLSKTANAQELTSALQQICAGRKYVSASLAEALAEYVSADAAQMPHEKLSNREYQTLCMLGSGKRLTDVAEVLSLSVKTVSVYRARLLEKLGLANNAELTYYVMRNQLVDLGANRTNAA
ncbi:response regulator transcription factor [Robbsia sp. KACC 23696]|uniref:response regulator transcription factor n=1 Tax=Robbsia sp. KACC 23696 TaxID=3149231 RepID=UPI00325B443D